MSKRKKKNAITLISLLLATVGLIIFYIWYSAKDQTSKDDTSNKGSNTGVEEQGSDMVNPTPIPELAAMDISLINSIHLVNPEADLKLYLEGTVWKSEADPERPINQNNVNNMLNLVSSVNSKRLIVDKPEDPAEYGLSEPAIYVEAQQSDGKTLRLNIGDKAIGEEGYYAQVNDSETVYLLESTYGTGFDYSDQEMTAVEDVPAITAENIHHILVENKAEENFELRYDPENNSDDTGSGMFPWVVLQPYEEGYSADSSKVSEILPNYASFIFLSCIDYAGKNLEKYGLEDPAATIFVEYYEYYTMTLDKPETDPNTGEEITEKTYYDEKNFKVYVGNSDGEGNYYVRREGNSSVYTMKAEEIDKMLQTDPFKLLSSFIAIPNIQTVEKIEIDIDGKSYLMEIKSEQGKNEAGEAETKYTYFYNGNTVTEEVFKDVYQIIIAAGYDAQMKEPMAEKEFDPYLTITYHLSGNNSLTASYMPYNDSFYIVKVGEDPIRFFSDKREIEEIIQAIVEFKGTEE